jgi:hypothetical protein
MKQLTSKKHKKNKVCFVLVTCLASSLILKKEAVCLPEILGLHGVMSQKITLL